MNAREWLDLVLDAGWRRRFTSIVATDRLGFPGYAAQLEAARAKTKETESVVVALGTVAGTEVVAISFEFGFLGGSMGAATGERICKAFELAARKRVPVIALTASGGARMQEGMLALAQMPATLDARAKLAKARQPFVAYMRNPTTGGVYASFASSADLLWAEPGATIGFAGPRVAEVVTGDALPEGSHTAESAHEACLVDEIVRSEDLKARLRAVLETLQTQAPPHPKPPAEPASGVTDEWEAVQLARRAARPTGTDYPDLTIALRRGGPSRDVVRCALATVAGRAVVAIALNRRWIAGRPIPGGYRRARNAISTAERLGLPVVTFVDTPGAEPGAQAERDGIAREISLTFDALRAASVPTVACVVGEGGSGGALAFSACDRILIQENAIFSVIAPEGAASILSRGDVAQVARDLKLGARALRDVGLADAIVAEPNGGAHADPEGAKQELERAIAWALADIGPKEDRGKRWRTYR